MTKRIKIIDLPELDPIVRDVLLPLGLIHGN
jgi:hypothetical protein